MNRSGYGSSVEASNAVGGVEASENLKAVTKHTSLGALMLDDNSGYLKGMRQKDATESIAQSDHIVVVSNDCRNQSSSDEEVSPN